MKRQDRGLVSSRSARWSAGCIAAVITALIWLLVTDYGEPGVHMDISIAGTSSSVNALVELTNRNERYLHSCVVELQTGPRDLSVADWAASGKGTADLSRPFELAPYEKKGWTIPITPRVQHFGITGTTRCRYFDRSGAWKTLDVTLRR